MKRDWSLKLSHSSRQYLLGGVSLALLTFVCFRLGLNLAATGFAYLILVAIASLSGNLIGSLVIAIAASGCLDYFFTTPLFSFRIESPQDLFAVIAFSTTAIIIARLTAMASKAAEEAQASQKALIDTMPARVWSALPDGSHDFHSQRWLEYSGLSAAEAGGDGWIATIHPDDRARVLDKWRLAVATGELFEVEARKRSATGEYRSFLLQARPLRGERGIVKWCGSSTDLEDSKRAVEALRESEQQWREVFEHNPAMYFMVDATGAVLSVNAFGAMQLGYTVGELVGRSVLDVFLEEDREFVQRNLATCLENLSQSNSWEVRKVRKDGATIWVRESAKAVRRADNRLIVLIACEDITESKRAKDSLRQSEMYLAEAQRISRTGSFGWSDAGREIRWSDETYRILEIDRKVKPTLELVFERTHPKDRAFFRRFVEGVLEDGKDWESERRLLMPDGSVKHVRAAAHAVKDASGNLEFVGALMDVTAARRAEEELLEAQAELARVARVTMLGELTAAIVHEVSQPLTGLVSSGHACLRWLAGETPDLEAARRAVERIINDGARAGEVLARIRALVKKSPPRRDCFNINDAIKEVVALIRSEVERNRISLETEVSNDLPLVLADRIQLQQVILNLMINAIEAMSGIAGGSRKLLVAAAKDGSSAVLVTVRDFRPGAGRDSARAPL